MGKEGGPYKGGAGGGDPNGAAGGQPWVGCGFLVLRKDKSGLCSSSSNDCRLAHASAAIIFLGVGCVYVLRHFQPMAVFLGRRALLACRCLATWADSACGLFRNMGCPKTWAVSKRGAVPERGLFRKGDCSKTWAVSKRGAVPERGLFRKGGCSRTWAVPKRGLFRNVGCFERWVLLGDGLLACGLFRNVAMALVCGLLSIWAVVDTTILSMPAHLMAHELFWTCELLSRIGAVLERLGFFGSMLFLLHCCFCIRELCGSRASGNEGLFGRLGS
jgi:hypothetical protein